MRLLFATFLVFSLSVSAQSDYVTQVTYSELNPVDQRMQSFMRDKMGMIISKPPTFGRDEGMLTLLIRYSKQAIMGTTYDPRVFFKYYLFDLGGGSTIIKSCQIYGDYNLVVNFYVRYWPTTINLEALKKDRIAYSFYQQDKITLSVNLEGNSARLTINNTTINSLAEYKSKAKEQQRYLDSVTEARTRVNQARADSAKKAECAASAYRDSLIKVAHSYDIPFMVTNQYNPDSKWLEWVIANKKAGWNSGQERNNSDIKDLIDSIRANVPIDKDDYFFADIIIHVDKNGQIVNVEKGNVSKIFSDKYLTKINQVCTRRSLAPFIAKDGFAYPSQIKCFVQFTNIGLSISER